MVQTRFYCTVPVNCITRGVQNRSREEEKYFQSLGQCVLRVVTAELSLRLIYDHTMETWRSGIIAPHILELGARWSCEVIFRHHRYVSPPPPYNHYIDGWVGPNTGMEFVQKGNIFRC
jgi:hypothetical protein